MASHPRFYLPFFSILLPILLYSIYRFSTGPLLGTIEEQYAFSNPSAGILLSLALAGTGVGTALSGFLSTKYGESTTAFFGLLIFSVPMCLSVVSKSSILFSTLFILGGLGGGLMTTPTYAIAGNLLPKRRGAAIGFLSACYNLGGFIGPALTGFLLGYVGWQYPFFVMAAIGIGFAIVLRAGLPRTYDSPSAKGGGNLKSGFRQAISNKNIMVLGFSMLLADFAFLAYVTWTITYLAHAFNLDLAGSLALDLYFGIAVGLGGIGIIVGGFMLDKYGGKRTALLSAIAATILTFGLYSVSSFLASVALMFGVGFFSNWFWGVLSAMAQSQVSPEIRSAVTSFVQTIAFVGAVFGPFFAGILLGGQVSSAPLMLTVTAPYLLFTLLILFFYSDPLPRTQVEKSY